MAINPDFISPYGFETKKPAIYARSAATAFFAGR